jgi:hypothetical protein
MARSWGQRYRQNRTSGKPAFLKRHGTNPGRFHILDVRGEDFFTGCLSHRACCHPKWTVAAPPDGGAAKRGRQPVRWFEDLYALRAKGGV